MKLIHKTAIPFVIMIGLILVGIAYLSSSSLEHALILQDFDRVKVVAINALDLETGDHHGEGGEELAEEPQEGVEPRTQILEERDFRNPNTPEARNQFHRYVEEFKDPIVTEINVFDGSGKIIVSNIERKAGSYVNSEALKVFGGESFYVLSKQNEEDVILAYVPFEFGGQVLGAVEVQSQLSHVLTPIENEMKRISLFLGIAGIIALIFFYFIQRQFIIKPIYYLKHHAELIGGGDLKEPIGLNTQDELGVLANFFEYMRRSIQSSIERITNFNEELAAKVRERTEELRDEQAKLVASIESLKFGFIIIDLNKTIIHFNVASKVILEATSRNIDFELIRNYFRDSIKFEEIYTRTLSDQESFVSPEIDLKNKFLKVLISPVVSEGKVIGSMVIIEDVTDETLLKRKKEEFFAVASHEIRTPLTSIRGNLSLIQDYYKDKMQSQEVLDMVAQAHESAVNLIGIINDFLEATKLEQTHKLGKLTTVDLTKVVRETAESFRASAQGKGLALNVDIKDGIPSVLGDEGKIKEIVSNLIANAINYTEKGEVRVEVDVEGESVKTTVKDTGIGIAPQNQKLLFKKFQQAGNSVYSRTNGSGTGMGLYICKLLIEAMNGQVALAESSGSGSTFFFTIPIAK